jgi:1-deoxy-D-xylulose 5-phosphate reductoisomerase
MGINITLSNKRILLIMGPLFMQTLSATFPKIFPFPKNHL